MASPPLTFTNPFAAAAAAARSAHKPDTQRGSGVDDDHDDDGASNWAPRSPDLSAAALPTPVDVNEHPQHHGFRGSISHTAPLLSPAVVTPSTSSPRRADFFAMPRGVRRTKREPEREREHEHDPEPDAAAAAVVHAADADANATPDASSATPATTAAPSTRGADADDDDDMADEPAQAPRAGRGRGRNKRAKLDVKEEPQQDPPQDPPQEQPAEAADEKPAEQQGAGEIKVSTKFPTARIKRIMQADDDVGKVAQVTPVAVAKALELFMISLVTKAAAEAKQRASKRISVQHLKLAVQKEPTFDFLSEIVSKIPDPPPLAAPRVADDAATEQDGKKRRGGRRKKADAAA